MVQQAKFYLESRKDKEGNPITTNVPIRLSFHFDGKRLEYYTGIRIRNAGNFNKDHFNTGKSPVKPNEPEAGRLNKKLRDLKAKAESIYDNAVALAIAPTPEYIKLKLDEQFKGKSEKPTELLVKDAFTEFLNYIKEKRSYRTWQKFNTTFNHLSAAFGKSFTKLTFTDINTAFVEKFRKALLQQGYTEIDGKKEYLNNTIVKYLRSFREFLNWCKDEERQYYSGNAKFKETSENEIDVIYLTGEQIRHLENTPMPNGTLERVKDVFVFGCYTGLRYSDIYKLKKKDILEQDIRLYITKGNKTTAHKVPLLEQSRSILNKYKDINGEKALPVISNQKMNDYLKEVMKIAEFNDIITIREKKGDGSLEEKEFALWEKITCHTSRKSFISLAVERGMKEMDIKSITGHSKNSRAFTRYFEVSDERKRREMHKIFGEGGSSKLKAV